MIKFCCDIMDTNYDIITFSSKRPRVKICWHIKIATMSVKTTFTVAKKIKRIRNCLYSNAIYICISWYSKSCWFPVRKCWFQQNSWGVSHDLYIFWIFFRYQISSLYRVATKNLQQFFWGFSKFFRVVSINRIVISSPVSWRTTKTCKRGKITQYRNCNKSGNTL